MGSEEVVDTVPVTVSSCHTGSSCMQRCVSQLLPSSQHTHLTETPPPRAGPPPCPGMKTSSGRLECRWQQRTGTGAPRVPRHTQNAAAGCWAWRWRHGGSATGSLCPARCRRPEGCPRHLGGDNLQGRGTFSSAVLAGDCPRHPQPQPTRAARRPAAHSQQQQRGNAPAAGAVTRAHLLRPWSPMGAVPDVHSTCARLWPCALCSRPAARPSFGLATRLGHLGFHVSRKDPLYLGAVLQSDTLPGLGRKAVQPGVS